MKVSIVAGYTTRPGPISGPTGEVSVSGMSDTPAIRLTRDAKRLITLGQALARSGSRLEDIYWEELLGQLITKLLTGKKSKSLENVLDVLVSQDIGVYEILIELAETHSESMSLEAQDGGEYEVLLVSAPIVAWSRYRLPEGKLTDEQRDGLKNAIAESIAAPGAKISMLPDLVTFDQMPQTFQETRAWTQCLGMQALGKLIEACAVGQAPDIEGMLADARFAVAAVVKCRVPKGDAVFRWQTPKDLRLKRDQAPGSLVATHQELYRAPSRGARREILSGRLLHHQSGSGPAHQASRPRAAKTVDGGEHAGAGTASGHRGLRQYRCRGIPHRLHPTREQRGDLRLCVARTEQGRSHY